MLTPGIDFTALIAECATTLAVPTCTMESRNCFDPSSLSMPYSRARPCNSPSSSGESTKESAIGIGTAPTVAPAATQAPIRPCASTRLRVSLNAMRSCEPPRIPSGIAFIVSSMRSEIPSGPANAVSSIT